MLDPDRRVQEGEISLQSNGGCVRGSYPKEPFRHAGRDPDNPGTVPWYYIREQGLLVIDLEGQFDDD